MIGGLPQYQITCNCGIRITGLNEKNLVSLVKLHLESGIYHTAYVFLNRLMPGDSELERVIKEAHLLKRRNDTNTSTSIKEKK